MPFFSWTSDMSVGLSRLDDDHKVLVSIINQIADTLESNCDEQTMEQAFRALIRYTEIHFGREESVLSAVNYADIHNHREEHRNFVNDVLELQKEFETSPDKKARLKVLDFLKSWLINHIMVEDKAYRPFVIDNPKAAKASEVFSSIGLWTNR